MIYFVRVDPDPEDCVENVVKLVWAVNLFFFALVLIFVWSKMLAIGNRISSIGKQLSEIDEMTGKTETSGSDSQQNA